MAVAPKTRRPSVREAQKELTREMLVDAAQAAFEADGYVGATVDDIAQSAGASRATFYAYFESKVQVLEAVLRKLQMREEYQVLLEHFRAIEKPTVAALQGWLEEYVDFYVKNLRIHQAIHQAEAIEPEFTDALLETLREYIELWGSLGFVRDPTSEDLRLGAMMMFALGDQFMYLWLVHGFEADRQKATRALAEFFYATLRRG
jgi:AcrR family transcriptional regulator